MQRLAAIHRKHDIKVQAYGPQTPLFRSPGGPLDPVVEGIAKKHGATSGQVLLAWAHQQPGGIVVT
jgi:diketogulonate reductase-like aldo/keto reductase